MGESSVTGAGQAGIGAGLEWLGRKAGFCLCAVPKGWVSFSIALG